jgi:3-hydroxymyristoyl/3-hydroxydecanoyl-(acyl carrier protein) dehydratase
MFELMESIAVDAAGGVASGRAEVPIDHPSFAFLADHFVGAPVLPGSLQIELCAQIAGPLAEEVTALHHGTERWAFLGLVRHATFLEPAVLSARLVISAHVKRAEPSNVAVTASLARANGETLCRAELVMALRAADATWAEAIRRYRERVAAWKARGLT